MEESNVYQFVGGKRDGANYPVPGPVQVGTIIRLLLVADPSKAELYQMGTDGKFHFVTYAWVDSDTPRSADEKAAAIVPAKHLQQLLQRLSDVLADLNEAFVARGEFPRGIQVNGWSLQRKEADVPAQVQQLKSHSARVSKSRTNKNNRRTE